MIWLALGALGIAILGWRSAVTGRDQVIARADELKVNLEEKLDELRAATEAEIAGKNREIELAHKNLIAAKMINDRATAELQELYAQLAKAGAPGAGRHVAGLMQSIDEDDGA